jgi:cytochrome c oxidase subunit 4
MLIFVFALLFLPFLLFIIDHFSRQSFSIMLAPIRSSVSRTVARSSSSSVGRLSAGIGARRTLVTKEERWDLNTIKQANEQNLIPDQSGKANADLTASVPNLEARWAQLSKEEQYGIFRHLEELQRKDWKELSVDQKKAGTYT